MMYFITLISKYYYSDDINISELYNIVKKIISKFNIDGYEEYKYHNKILDICNKICSGEVNKELKNISFVPIYSSEINVIDTLQNDRQKKILFTFFAVARYMDSQGWINKKTSKDISEIFKLANVTLPSDKRNKLLHELFSNGYITFGKKVNNLNIKVNLDETGDIAYKVTNFNNLGNQYIGNFKNGYKQCKKCGKIIKDTGNKKTYCDKCADNNEKIRKKNTAYLYRETEKSSEIENL